MTKHTCNTKTYDGEGGGQRITLTVTLDALTLKIVKDDNVNALLEPLIKSLREAIEKAAGLAG